MKKTNSKTIRISFQEKHPNAQGPSASGAVLSGFVDKSFDAYREHLEFHLQQMQVGPNGVDASEKES